MRVLLTGATGFIGSEMARLLLSVGQEVQAVIHPASDPWRINDVLSSLEVIRHDLADHAAIRDRLATNPPDLCIHLAWRGWSGPSLTAKDNVSSLATSLEFLRSLADAGCRRFVGVGTCFEYDTDAGVLTEEASAQPKDIYGFFKHALSRANQYMAGLSKMEVAWARVFHVYGPFDDERRLIPSIALALLQDRTAEVTSGEQVRDFLHVEDVCSAIWAVAGSAYCGPVNVASGSPVTVKAVARELGRIIGRPEGVRLGALPYRAGEPKSLAADVSRLRDTIGWRPHYTLVDGLTQTVNWWKARTVSRNELVA